MVYHDFSKLVLGVIYFFRVPYAKGRYGNFSFLPGSQDRVYPAERTPTVSLPSSGWERMPWKLCFSGMIRAAG